MNMYNSPLVDRVIEFVKKAHAGAVDKSGSPYINHPLTVAESMADEDSTALALLHDVIEDTEYTYDDIRALGVSERVVDALQLLTHAEDVDYFDYVRMIKTNPLATAVKLADLRHNSDLTRLKVVTEKDERRVEKYAKAIKILTE